jgi:hypothetical protein
MLFLYAPQGITTVVSLLHTVFDMLAFKNDIGFWKNNKVRGMVTCVLTGAHAGYRVCVSASSYSSSMPVV